MAITRSRTTERESIRRVPAAQFRWRVREGLALLAAILTVGFALHIVSRSRVETLDAAAKALDAG